ncbi:hypothetical protein ACHAQA_002021 [Verticillium albo-atrum]
MADLFVKRVAEGIQRSPSLLNFLRPVANWYSNTSGYRQVGLRYDDLYEEEREEVGKALKRLSPKESYDRIYRIRRAVQCSYQHKLLPKSDWTKPEEDVPYLRPLIEQVETEMAEKKALDSLEVVKKH